MYYFASPYYYPIQNQMFLFPTTMQTHVTFENLILKKQNDFEEFPEQNKKLNTNPDLDSTQNKGPSSVIKSPEEKQAKYLIDSDYEPQRNQNFTFYKKKNTQSNLSNQIYSFMSSKKSARLFLKLLGGSQKKVEDLYKLIKTIKKTNKKYMNRSYLSEMIQLKDGGTNFKIYQRSKCPLQPEQIRKALRICYRYFLLNICDCGLLTSKKMNKNTLMEHFGRKREIMEYMNQQILGNSSKLN